MDQLFDFFSVQYLFAIFKKPIIFKSLVTDRLEVKQITRGIPFILKSCCSKSKGSVLSLVAEKPKSNGGSWINALTLWMDWQTQPLCLLEYNEFYKDSTFHLLLITFGWLSFNPHQCCVFFSLNQTERASLCHSHQDTWKYLSPPSHTEHLPFLILQLISSQF